MFPANLRIFNKVGDAYGYLIDNAYIANFDTGGGVYALGGDLLQQRRRFQR